MRPCHNSHTLFKFNRLNSLLVALKACLATCLLLASAQAYAAPNILEMIANISTTVDSFFVLLLVFCYVAGIHQVFSGLTKLKKFGNMNTQMSGSNELSGPLAHLIIGGILLYLPMASNVSIMSLFGTGEGDFLFTPGGKLTLKPGCSVETILTGAATATSCAAGNRSFWGSTANIGFKIVQLIGLLAFVRGWFIILKVIEQSSKTSGGGEGFGKGVTHIIGGILALNFLTMLRVISKSLGF
ncbi:MAG: hypothetical protein ACKOAD_05350 [Gammaproteobacteria bacterium]